jgi:carboxyl-terminal processing protease
VKKDLNRFCGVKKPLFGFFLFSIFFLGLIFPIDPGRNVLTLVRPVGNLQAEPRPDFNLIEEAWKTIRKAYVDQAAVKPKDLTYGAISGMVQALGDTGHSTFLSPEMLKLQQNFMRGKFEGIGAEVRMKEGQLVIVAPIDDSPAQQAGIVAGDVILRVNGQNITGLPLVQAVEKILGKAGTTVALTVLSPRTGTTRVVVLMRASITVHNVTWHGLPGTLFALVRIAGFSKGVTKGLQKELGELKKQNFHGVILDLRNNPGGLFDEAVTVASQFLRNGNVVLEKGVDGKINPVPVKPGGLLSELPLVLLVNAGTASAAEIVSGCLQDAHRATLVGETTFGTGTVLKEFPLFDGSALLLAVKEWLTPDGHTIWHKGITPDVLASLPPKISPLLPSKLRGMTKEGLMKSGDKPLLTALEILEKKTRKDPSIR